MGLVPAARMVDIRLGCLLDSYSALRNLPQHSYSDSLACRSKTLHNLCLTNPFVEGKLSRNLCFENLAVEAQHCANYVSPQ